MTWQWVVLILGIVWAFVPLLMLDRMYERREQ